MPDFDLALLYRVEAKSLHEQVKRNPARFPVDFMFKLTEKEWQNIQQHPGFFLLPNRNKQYLPYTFSEHGATILHKKPRKKVKKNSSASWDNKRQRIGFNK